MSDSRIEHEFLLVVVTVVRGKKCYLVSEHDDYYVYGYVFLCGTHLRYVKHRYQASRSLV